jgi:chromosome segregation ATPase
MVIRAALAAILGLAVGVPCMGQASQADSQALQSILTEIRGIHEDIRVTETSQILLTELGMQQSFVIRAIQRVDDAQSKLVQVESGQKHVAGDLTRLEDKLSQTTDSSETKRISEDIERARNDLSALKLEAQQDSTILQQSQEHLRTAQEALDGTQSELNAIVQRLRPAHN